MEGGSTALSTDTKHSQLCPLCGAPVSLQQRHCPACATDLGAPNVRECGLPAEREAVASRFSAARSVALSRGCAGPFQAFQDRLRESHVLIAMPAMAARKFLSSSTEIYSGYESLVGAGIRIPSSPEHDRERRAIGGQLFGSYAENIRYGVLSLSHLAPLSYGEVSLTLRDIAVKHRTSFLEQNSYFFVRDQKLKIGDSFPLGYRAVWDNRQDLALAKLGDSILSSHAEKDFAGLLLRSDGDRSTDEFIEAHIYDGFSREAIETVTMHPGCDDDAKLDARLALESFCRYRSGKETA